jgi:hypothetical protein
VRRAGSTDQFLREVLELLFEEDNSLRERLPRFVGVQQIELA